MKNINLRMTISRRKVLGGIIFTLPFTLGFIFLFLYPFIQAIIFSLNELELTATGFVLNFQGLSNYKYALTVHSSFNRVFTETIMTMIREVPLVLSFSFFAAILLNQKFKGRFLARLIFFLPVIMSAGIILRIEQVDFISTMMEYSGEAMFSGAALQELMMQIRLPENFLEYIISAVDGVPHIIRLSGIQILIFLAGLQSIPGTIYEAAKVEGATGWECFWLITLPMLSPLIITNIVYSIIDSFTMANNQLIQLIRDAAFGSAGYGVSSAMSIMYFIAVLIILAFVVLFINKHVFYME